MCSINGCTGQDPDLIARMNAATSHRGPDDTGIWHDEKITLGNNRLAIIDLSPLGHQPMQDRNGRHVIAYNGEIYNYRELRKELPEYPFRSDSDTEVLLAGFSKWGTKLFPKLNGIFAFAIWDQQTKELFLVRDRMGIKPLYLHRGKERTTFSSEIKAILEDRSVPRRIDTAALETYLRVGYVPGPRTLFEGIEKVPAATFVKIAHGKLSMERYWEPAYAPEISGEAARIAVRDTVDAAVARQLVSDRPLGIYLSGGIDSSIILDAMSRVHSAIDTYSVGFELSDPVEMEKFNADFLLARRTAAQYGTRHHEYLMNTKDLQSLFEDAIYHLDEPIGNATALPQLALSRFAKIGVTVVLGGDGGDELFAGYPRFSMSRKMDLYQKIPSVLRGLLSLSPQLSKLSTPPGADRYALMHFIKDPLIRELAPKLATDRLQREAQRVLASYGDLPFTEKFMRLDREWWLVDESLLRTDKMTMAAGIEARVPFLDNEVVALADRIPLREKITFNDTKVILKRAYEERLPSYLLNQPKRGWFSPGAKWLRDPDFNTYAREVLSEGYAEATRRLFDWPAVSRMFDEHVEGERYNLHLLWSLLSLQVWAQKFELKA